MKHIVIIVCVCLSASVLGAPTEPSASSTSSDQTSSAPATSMEDPQRGDNTTLPMMSTGTTHEALKGSTFTCLGRTVGYYADIERKCRVYHFCLLGEYNGEPVYQRVSYLCLNETIFDQQALDCVASEKITAPCEESESYYTISNQILREAIVGNQMQQSNDQKATTAASSES